MLSIYTVNIVNCANVITKNDGKDTKAAPSIRTYSQSFAPPNFSKLGNDNFEKTISFLKSLEDQQISSNPLLNQHFVGKSIVQFWPADMDKKQFFDSMLGPAWSEDIKFKKEPSIFSATAIPTQQEEPSYYPDSGISYQPEEHSYFADAYTTTDLPPIASLPEKLPDIPIPNFDEYEIYEKSVHVPQQSKKARKPIKDHKIELMKVNVVQQQQQPITIENYQNYNHHPTQAIVVATENYYSDEDYVAITNPGPVRFLHLQPEPESNLAEAHHDYKFPTRANNNNGGFVGNKKRKLKKKVKPAQQNNVQQHFTETTASYTSPHSEQFTVSAIAPENVHVQIVEGNGFDTSVAPPTADQFANVIDNVSNLTELSFRKNNIDNENSKSISSSDERTRFTVVESYEAKRSKTKSEPVTEAEKKASASRQKYRGMSVNDLKPWDFMYVQLSRAIEDRDLVKIKSLVNAIGEKEKSKKLKKVGRGRVTTTAAPVEELTSFRSRLTTTEAPETTVEVTEPVTIIETTTRRRYLAPRVRLSLQKVLKEREESMTSTTSEPQSIENEESITTEIITEKPSTLAMTLKVFSTTSEQPEESATELQTTVASTVRPLRLRSTTERVKSTTSTADKTSKATTRHHRRGRIVTPRNRKPKIAVDTTTPLPTTTSNSSLPAIRPIRNSSRVRRIKGFRRMAGLSRY